MSQKTDSADRAEIDRIKKAATGDRPDAPGSLWGGGTPPVQGSPTTKLVLLAYSYTRQMKIPHGVRPPGMREGASPPDRTPKKKKKKKKKKKIKKKQAFQTPVDSGSSEVSASRLNRA